MGNIKVRFCTPGTRQWADPDKHSQIRIPGNPASLLISPDGGFASIVALKSRPLEPYSVSIGSGQVTPLVFASDTITTFDLGVGVSTGSLTATYTQGVHIRADLTYQNGTRTLVAQSLPDAYSTIVGAGVPASGAAAVWVSHSAQPNASFKGTWSYTSSDGTFKVAAGDCLISGRALSEVGLNALVLSASPSAACATSSAVHGYAWNDSVKGLGYAVLKPSAEVRPSSAIVIVLSR